MLLCCLLFLPVSGVMAADILTANYIDVGQGDSILIQLPNGQNMLIDAGPTDTASTVTAFLKSKGIKTIDYRFD